MAPNDVSGFRRSLCACRDTSFASFGLGFEPRTTDELKEKALFRFLYMKAILPTMHRNRKSMHSYRILFAA